MTEGSECQQNTCQTQGWENVTHALQLAHQKAKTNKKMKFTALMHHIYNVDTLRKSFIQLKKGAAPGVDGVKWQDYEKNLESNLQDLSRRLRHGAYQPKPVRRVFIPKADGRKRPLGVTAIEDKLVQRAAVTVLNAIYEADFIGFSYGFRPKRKQHDALDALYVALTMKKVNWVLDADISDFFNSISQTWLLRFIEHRIADKRVIRLVQKWLKAGVLEDGKFHVAEEGTPQGGCASPLMGNIYLHYVYDLWVSQWRKKQAHGEVIVVRYADDTITGFQHKSDAEQFVKDLTERFREFGLTLHPSKTRLIEFGRYADHNRKQRGDGKPETFNFLGLTHVCGTTRDGRFTIKRHTIRKRLHAKVKEVATELRKRMNSSVFETGTWLKKVVQGFYQYHAVQHNIQALQDFRYLVYWHWRRVLIRRSHKAKCTWERMNELIDRWIPKPRIIHPNPLRRFGAVPR